nr:anti-sigma factor antagonist [Lientehia hominis]
MCSFFCRKSEEFRHKTPAVSEKCKNRVKYSQSRRNRKLENGANYKVRGTVLYALMPKEVDHHSSQEMKLGIAEARGRRKVTRLVFDFSKTDFMDSSGIGMILGRYKEMAAVGGEVFVKDASPRVKKILEMSGIYRIIQSWDGQNEERGR